VVAVETASELGIEKVVLHPPSLMGLGKFAREKVRRYGLSSLRTILEEAKHFNLTVCMENMFPKTGSFATPGEFRTLLEEFPELSMTLDVGHAFLAGGLRNVLEFISLFGDRIHHVHANDNFGRVDSHLPVGAGLIDFARISKELKASGYDDTMTVEVFSRDREYLTMSREKLRRLWDEVA
jgi:sugar phosphate isomerase/epimerase